MPAACNGSDGRMMPKPSMSTKTAKQTATVAERRITRPPNAKAFRQRPCVGRAGEPRILDRNNQTNRCTWSTYGPTGPAHTITCVTVDPGLDAFNRLPDAQVRLRACCASTPWATRVADGRPYRSRPALLSTSAAALATLDWSGLRAAVDAHPRIGERPDHTGPEAAWSTTEQAGMNTATDGTRAALVEANRAYEDRFGHVFLICATGRTDVEMLAAARARVGNDEQTERAVVRAELAKIVVLRLGRLLDALAPR
jgi:2-oxo-4-hydroxy-4-carboxy-5-ureidoimidazoline decarboxylase